MKKCDGKDCNAELVMIMMETGKYMPCEAEPQKRVIMNSENKGMLREVWEPHWGNCPDFKKFKRGK